MIVNQLIDELIRENKDRPFFRDEPICPFCESGLHDSHPDIARLFKCGCPCHGGHTK